MKKKQIFKIPLTWEVYGVLEVEGKETFEEAYKYAISDEAPLPTESDYVDGSLLPAYDMDELKELFPDYAEGEDIVGVFPEDISGQKD